MVWLVYLVLLVLWAHVYLDLLDLKDSTDQLVSLDSQVRPPQVCFPTQTLGLPSNFNVRPKESFTKKNLL